MRDDVGRRGIEHGFRADRGGGAAAVRRGFDDDDLVDAEGAEPQEAPDPDRPRAEHDRGPSRFGAALADGVERDGERLASAPALALTPGGNRCAIDRRTTVYSASPPPPVPMPWQSICSQRLWKPAAQCVHVPHVHSGAIATRSPGASGSRSPGPSSVAAPSSTTSAENSCPTMIGSGAGLIGPS